MDDREVRNPGPLATGLGTELYSVCFLSSELARVGIVSAAWWELGSFALILLIMLGFPGGARGQEPTCQYKRLQCDPWVRKIPGRRACQPTLVFLPGVSPWTEEPGRLQSIVSQRVIHD